MIHSQTLFRALGLSTAFFSAFFLVSCSGDKPLGATIPADAPQATLAAIIAAPADYNGKKVVMNGIVSAQCPSLCEFTYKEGVQSTLVFPQGFKFPKLKTGRPVTLYAEITAGSGSVVVSALGIQMK
jgi:hypothetical protein